MSEEPGISETVLREVCRDPILGEIVASRYSVRRGTGDEAAYCRAQVKYLLAQPMPDNPRAHQRMQLTIAHFNRRYFSAKAADRPARAR